MSLFTKAENTSSHLKMGMMGFQGSGKTHTATSVAIGLVKLMRELNHPAANKPIAFIDTEKGSDWVIPRVNAAGIDMVTRKTRAFSDLLAAVPEAEANASVLIVDSVTHFWVEFCETYCARRAKELKRASYRLQFQDWAFLKQEWRKFTDAFVNSSVHMVICGRAGYEYDFFEDDDGKKQLEKTGVKFKAEGEMGYEPDLLVLMARRMNMETKNDEHTAHVVKDRSTMLDGKEFVDPTFESFLPHIKCLNLGGRQLGVDTSRNSGDIIPAVDGKDNRRTQRKIVLAEIEDLLVTHHPSTGGADKKAKIELLRTHFKASWVEMEEVMPLEQLRKGYDTMHFTLETAYSRYHQERIAEQINDGLPAHSAKPAIDETDIDGTPAFLKRTKPTVVPVAAEPAEKLPAHIQRNLDRLKKVRVPELAPPDAAEVPYWEAALAAE